MTHLADTGTQSDLSTLGYGGPWPALLNEISPDGLHGRVTRADRGAATVFTTDGEHRASWPPTHEPPVTGDWVVIDPTPHGASGDAWLLGIAPRQTTMSRPNTHGQRSSNRPDQVLAANVDLVGVVAPINRDLNIRRLERGIILAYESGATPVVLLTKADLSDAPEHAHRQAEGASPGLDVLLVAPPTGQGVEEVRQMLVPDKTIVLLGQSGAGKSTLTNALVGDEVLVTQDIREADGRGRHTTTHRELVGLPSGGAVLDTPGLRTLGLGQVDESIGLAFPDIEELAPGCRFADCRHDNEPGCAVLAALDLGALDPDRLEGWRRIRAASENAALRADTAAWRKETRSWGRVYREAQAVKNRGDGR